MITVEVFGHEIEIGILEGVSVSKNGVNVGKTHRIDFVEGNNISFDIQKVAGKIVVKASASGSGGGGGLNATVSGGVKYVPNVDPLQPGNIQMGSVLIEDVLIPGGNFGAQWGDDDSFLSHFRLIGQGWQMLWSQATLYFKSFTGFGFEGEGTAPAWFNNLMGVVIGSNSIQGSAILQLVSNTKAFLINIVTSLPGITAPQQGMVVGSVQKDDLMLYWNNVWTGVTRPEIFVTDEQHIVLEEMHRNAIIISTFNGNATATPALGLSKGWTAFVAKKNGTNGYLAFSEGPYTEIDAFDLRIYVGGASIIHQGGNVFYASGSLGPFVDSNALTAAIAAAEEAAKSYSDLIHFASNITGTATLQISQASKMVKVLSATPVTITVPPDSAVNFTSGTPILFQQAGAGQVTFAEGIYVDIQSSGNKLKTSAQYALCTLIKTGGNEWALSGDLTT